MSESQFSNLTIVEQERFLTRARSLKLTRKTNSSLPILHVDRSVPLPLSFAQQRLWFLAQIEGGSEAYHVPLGLRLRGKLHRIALWKALNQIVARHEVLRTTFIPVDGVPVQIHGMDADEIFVDDGDLDAARALVASAGNAELFLYPGSGHLFADTSLPSYDPAAAELLTERVIGFLDTV